MACKSQPCRVGCSPFESTMDLTGKKLLICEEALLDEKGHFQSWIKAIRQMHLDAEAKVFVAGNVLVTDAVKQDLEVLPIFRVNSWEQSETGKWPGWRRHLHVWAQNWRIFWETRRVLKQTGSVDMVMFTAVRVHQILGLRLLCALGLGRWFKRMVVFLLTSQAEYNTDFSEYKFPKRSQLIALTLRSFKKLVEKGHVILAGDSHITCREYETLAGVSMTLFPSPGANLRHARTELPQEQVIFTMLGVSTWDKGIDVFHDAIELFLGRHPESKAKFVLQWGVPCQGPDGKVKEISPKLREDARVVLLERRLTNSEYAQFMGDTDFIVLPYRRCTYFNRLSGVAVEAAVSGKPMIVTENTWLGWALSEFGCGMTVSEGDVISLCRAIEKCVSNKEELKKEGELRSEVALEYNSALRYLEILWSKETVRYVI